MSMQAGPSTSSSIAGMTSVKSNSKLDCKDLHSYIRTLPPAVLDRLYRHPAACLTVFRDLTDLSKHYVMRVLFVEQSVTQAVMTAWLSGDHVSKHAEIIKSLVTLHIFQEQPQGGVQAWKLNDTFRKSLKIALLGGGTSWTGGGPLPPERKAKDIQSLDTYAIQRWESVLHFMVKSAGAVEKTSTEAVDTLVYAGLIKRGDRESDIDITPAGFQFLLLDRSSQIWYFLLKYLENAQENKVDMVECLTFLFQLSYLQLGKDYSSEGVSESQSKFLQYLRGIGLVFQRTKKVQRFYPTRLAVNLASGVSKQSHTTDSNQLGFIIVETNYRVYAYTDSSLHLALLALFTKMLYRFPDMAAGIITRDSVRDALTMGISAEQIINYLRSHCHPQMLRKTPALPPTVTDQIRLWEMEMDRLEFAEGVLYSQFTSQSDFEVLRNYARAISPNREKNLQRQMAIKRLCVTVQDISVLVWENPQKRLLVVTKGGHEERIFEADQQAPETGLLIKC